MAFPWVLRVLDIKAFELFKVLESFIRAEPSLTRDVVKVCELIHYWCMYLCKIDNSCTYTIDGV